MHDMRPGIVCEHFQRAAELIGRRWNVLIVRVLQGGPARYTELRRGLPQVSDAMLSERLKELEAADIVRRNVAPSTPVKISYELTDRGRDLAAVMDRLGTWAERWADQRVSS